MSGDGVLVITAWLDADGRLRARVRDTAHANPADPQADRQIAGVVMASRVEVVEYVDSWLAQL